MARPVFREDQRFTYRDSLTWPEEERWELIEGIPFAMTPTPSRRHQGIVVELTAQLRTALRGHPCRVYCAPFDVRLPEPGEQADSVSTVVQPDLSVICDPSKLDDRGCLGAPDLVIEVISPGTAARDQIEKAALYERHGVREYWILHPADQLIILRVLEESGRFGAPRFLKMSGTHPISVLPGLAVNLDLLDA